MTKDIKNPVELNDEILDQVEGGASCQNNLKQIGLASHNYDASSHPGGVNVALGDGSVRFVRGN